jgi:archaellum biogenesis ATPase FlaH
MNTETKRMATLIKSPELAKQCLSVIDEQCWTATANAWLWDKIKCHEAVYHTIPTIDILADYANKKPSNENENIMLLGAKNILNECQSITNDEMEYFRKTIYTEARNTKLKNTITACLEHRDIVGMRDALDVAMREVSMLPPLQSINSFNTKPLTDVDNLLNNWWLEREAIVCLVGATGFGKSTLSIQLACSLGAGKECVGLKPTKPFRVLVIQCEDSDNDIAVMRDGAMSQLTDAEKQLATENVRIVRLRGHSGKEFLTALDDYSQQFKPDIVFVNPLLKYFGDDAISNKAVSQFFNELEPILAKHRCAMVLVHHTVKQSRLSRQNQTDTAYAGYGSAVWSNSVRDTLEISATNVDGRYVIKAGKRSSKLGWKEKYIKRSQDPALPYWSECNPAEIDNIIDASGTNETKELIFNAIPLKPNAITVKELVSAVRKSDKTIRNCLAMLEDESRIAYDDMSDNGKKGGPKNIRRPIFLMSCAGRGGLWRRCVR